MDKLSKIYVAGHSGMVGSAIVKCLKDQGYHNIITRNHKDLDLTNQYQTNTFFHSEKPEYVFIAAAKVGGIQANITYPVEFLYDNMMINANIIRAAHEVGVKKVMILGSSCIYPAGVTQPMKEEALLSGKPEATNEGYAIGKIAALELCKMYRKQYGVPYISCMPTNIYGENDNFDLNSSHVIPSMIRKFHEAKVRNQQEVILWGTGTPLREFLYVDDLAAACIFLMNNYDSDEAINVGTGEEVSIKDLAIIIKSVVGFKGDIVFDVAKPDGNPRKLLDSTKIHTMGWKHTISLHEGIKKTYKWFLDKYNLEGY